LISTKIKKKKNRKEICTKDDKEQLLCFAVFEDLWKQNYFLTDGSKFGGHYLCYAGKNKKKKNIKI
jgi:hypothetical protein